MLLLPVAAVAAVKQEQNNKMSKGALLRQLILGTLKYENKRNKEAQVAAADSASYCTTPLAKYILKI